MSKPVKKDAPKKEAGEAKAISPVADAHDPPHEKHEEVAPPTTASGILIHRFKALDVDALKPADCRALIDEIRSVLAKGKEGMPVDLGDRVKLIRIWNALAWYVEEPDPDLVPEAPHIPETSQVPEAPEEHLTDEHTEPVHVDVTHEPIEEPQTETLEEIVPEIETPARDEVASSEFLTDHEPPVLVEEAPSSAPPNVREIDFVHEEPLNPQIVHAAPEPAIARKRLRMIQDGVLVGRVLEAGTIVLVYPLDAQHLIEEGIAEMIDDPASPDESESSSTIS